ncbi:unnamed protein product [Didymodactylos carnosus]|uniref:Tetratricopeptide repeat protein n=1 Tax=Didymodactylos carnosus TaxID=1234261 RepID=A0A815YKI7_9BILA|nr:unnamed protein product [Didymodactylos carnosus]CAF4435277.1 unnamed protein product [Didymodactylos carnosus]
MWQKYAHDDELNSSANIGKIHQELSYFYRDKLKDKNLENTHYNQAIKWYSSALEKYNTNPAEVATVYESIAVAYRLKMQIEDDDKTANALAAIEHQELCMQQLLIYCSPNRKKVGDALKELAQTIGLWDEGVTNSQKALDIYIYQNSCYNYDDIVSLCTGIVGIYTHQKGENYAPALKYQLLKHEFEVKQLNEIVEDDGEDQVYHKHTGIGWSHEEVADMYIKLGEYELACQNLQLAKKIYEGSDPNDREELNYYLEEKLRSIESFLGK